MIATAALEVVLALEIVVGVDEVIGGAPAWMPAQITPTREANPRRISAAFRPDEELERLVRLAGGGGR
jgi:hypothetical protein